MYHNNNPLYPPSLPFPVFLTPPPAPPSSFPTSLPLASLPIVLPSGEQCRIELKVDRVILVCLPFSVKTSNTLDTPGVSKIPDNRG